jgi:hypothetical protein
MREIIPGMKIHEVTDEELAEASPTFREHWTEAKLTIESVAHHRNGIGGEPFDVVLFTDPEQGPMVAIVFGAPDEDVEAPFNPRVAVLQREMLTQGNVTFGENSWRGDQYADRLYAAIREAAD